MATTRKLKDPSLLIGSNYVNGKWKSSTSGKVFNVYGKSHSSQRLAKQIFMSPQILLPTSVLAHVRSPLLPMPKKLSMPRLQPFLLGVAGQVAKDHDYYDAGTTWSLRMLRTCRH